MDRSYLNDGTGTGLQSPGSVLRISAAVNRSKRSASRSKRRNLSTARTLAPGGRSLPNSRKSAKGPGAQRLSPSRKKKNVRPARVSTAFGSRLSVIISARDEEETLLHVIKQAQHLKPAEIIIVLNGCRDRSFQKARLCKEAIIVHCPESAGHDVGRAIGAKLSRGGILLFLDGDMVIPASLLVSFLAAVDQGVDVALNNIDPLLPAFAQWDDVTRCKLFLNAVLDRSDLGAASMTAVPHALSRRAVETIGFPQLMVPPKAQAIAIMEKLKVAKAGTVDVIRQNRQRKANTGDGNAMSRLISGDHAEALHEVLSREGSRLLAGGNNAENRRMTASWRNGL